MHRIVSILILGSCCAVAAPPRLTVPRVKAVPKIDGLLDDAAWTEASVANGFTRLGEKTRPREATSFRAVWDGTRLVVAVDCAESALVPAEQRAEQVKCSVRGRDGNVFADDVVEFFIDPLNDRPYVHLAVGAGGGRYDAQARNPAWNMEWTAAVRLDKGRWLVETAVPLEPILGRPPRPGDRIGFNVAREEKPASELSAWAPVSTGFHEPEHFGTVVLGPGSTPAVSLGVPEETTSTFSIPIRVKSSTHGPVRVRAVAAADGHSLGEKNVPATDARPHTIRLTVRPGPTTALAIEAFTGEHLVFRSPPIPLPGIGAAVYTAEFATTAGTLRLFLDGKPVAAAGVRQRLRSSLHLGRGVHLVLLECTGPGRVSGTLSSTDLSLPLDGAWRRHDGPLRSPPTQVKHAVDWGRARSLTLGKEGGWFARGLAVGGPARTVLVPNCTEARFPKGTPEMVYPTLNPPAIGLRGSYVCRVQFPEGFTVLAADGRAGQQFSALKAEKTAAGAVQVLLETPFLGQPGMEINSRFSDQSKSTTAYIATVRLGGTHDWRVCRGRVRTPENSIGLRPLFIKWQNRGVTGTCWIDDIEVTEVGSGRVLFRRTFEEPDWQHKTYVTTLSGAPGGHAARIAAVEKNQHQQALWLVEDPIPVQPGSLLEISCRARCRDLVARGTTAKAALVVRSDAEPSTVGTGRVWYEAAQGFLVEHPRRFKVRTLPPLLGRRPSRIRIVPCYYSDRFEETASKALAENIDKAGITGIYGGRSTLVDKYVRSRLHRIMSLPWHEFSAKVLGYAPGTLPAGCCQLDYKGKRHKDNACPTWLLSEAGDRFDKLGDWVAERLKTDGGYNEVDWDLETPVVDPPTFCFCPRCLAAFAKTAGLAPNKLSAKTVVGKYRDPWVAFRCGQNAKIAGLLAQQVHRVAPGTLFSVYSGHQNRRTREHYGVDWELMAKVVDAGIAGYGASPEQAKKTARALATHEKPFMGGEMYFLSLDGPTRGTWHPESWKVRLVRQTVESGGVGCLIWWLPVLDGAGFYETSRASGLLAAIEDFVVTNQRDGDSVRVLRGPARDVVVLRRNKRRCILLFNPSSKSRNFELEPGGVFAEMLETGRKGAPLPQTVTVPPRDVRAFVEAG